MRDVSKLLLLDGHSLAYRAFYALPDRSRDVLGTVTNAVYGFTSMLVKVLGDEKPDHLAVAFDAPAKTFRKEMDATYKAGRKETPDLFRVAAAADQAGARGARDPDARGRGRRSR